MRREYDQLVELGYLVGEPIELLRGMLVEMSPQGDAHGGVTEWIAQWFSRTLPMEEYRVRSQLPFAATDDSEPEPDLLVARRSTNGPGHPTNALLVVEISYSSLHKDGGVKPGIYAEAGVPEYWIIDVDSERVAVYTEPSGREYRRCEIVERTGMLRPGQLPGIELSVAALPWDAE